MRDFYNFKFSDDRLYVSAKVQGAEIHLNEDLLDLIIDVLLKEIWSMLSLYKKQPKSLKKIKRRILKKYLKGKFQLLFEIVNKVLLKRSKKKTTASIRGHVPHDNLSSSIMLEHMHRVMHV